MRAVALAPGGVMELVELGDSDQEQLRNVQRILGGYMEVVRVPNAPVLLLVNEDGLAEHLAPNMVACILAGVTIVGTVLLTGLEDSKGDLQSIPEHWVNAWQHRLVNHP